MKVRDVMTRRPISIRRTHRLKHALHTMAQHNISGCPVTDSKNNVIGIITKGDILGILDVHGKVHKTRDVFGFILSAIQSQEFDKLKAPLKELLEKEVQHFMSARPITVNENDDLYEAAKTITRHNVDKVLVVKDKKLVGILTKGDLIKVLDKLD